jgi:hypothetical protein
MLEKIQELQETLDQAQAHTMRLSGDKYGNHTDSWRPVVNLKIDRTPMHEGNTIHIRIDESMGHPTQYIELSPDEAGILARHLIELANYVEAGHPNGIEVEEESHE